MSRLGATITVDVVNVALYTGRGRLIRNISGITFAVAFIRYAPSSLRFRASVVIISQIPPHLDHFFCMNHTIHTSIYTVTQVILMICN